MREVVDPSMPSRRSSTSVPGTCITVTIETRAMLAECNPSSPPPPIQTHAAEVGLDSSEVPCSLPSPSG